MQWFPDWVAGPLKGFQNKSEGGHNVIENKNMSYTKFFVFVLLFALFFSFKIINTFTSSYIIKKISEKERPQFG